MKLSWQNVFHIHNTWALLDQVMQMAFDAGYPFFAFNDDIYMLVQKSDGSGNISRIKTGLTISANKECFK